MQLLLWGIIFDSKRARNTLLVRARRKDITNVTLLETWWQQCQGVPPTGFHLVTEIERKFKEMYLLRVNEWNRGVLKIRRKEESFKLFLWRVEGQPKKFIPLLGGVLRTQLIDNTGYIMRLAFLHHAFSLSTRMFSFRI